MDYNRSKILITDKQLKKLEVLLNSITPEAWSIHEEMEDCGFYETFINSKWDSSIEASICSVYDCNQPFYKENIEFISTMPTIVPKLIEEIKRLKKKNQRQVNLINNMTLSFLKK